MRAGRGNDRGAGRADPGTSGLVVSGFVPADFPVAADSSGGSRPKRMSVSLAVALGIVLPASAIGWFTAENPGLSVLTFGGAFLMAAALLAPSWTGMMLLAVSCVSVQYVFPDATLYGLELQALQKLALLAFLAPALLRYGISWSRLLPMAALAVSFALPWIWGKPADELTPAESFKSLLGLTAPLLFMAVRWPKRDAGRLIRVVLFLPVLSLAIGAGLQAAGLHPVFVREFTGVLRLQGANIPAHLAFLAFTALAASVLMWKKQSRRGGLLFVMIAVNFLILLLTGTRGPLVASVPLLFLFLADLARQFAKGKSGLVVPLAGIAGLIAASVVWQSDNLLKRSFTRTGSFGIDLSGREEAWRFFLERAGESPWFGQGLGSVLLANDGTLYVGFAVPHNEYIRFFHDAGIVGAALLFGAWLGVLTLAADRMTPGGKAYWGAMAAGFLLYSLTDNTLSTLQFMVPFCAMVGTCGAAGSGGGGPCGRRGNAGGRSVADAGIAAGAGSAAGAGFSAGSGSAAEAGFAAGAGSAAGAGLPGQNHTGPMPPGRAGAVHE